MVQIIGLYGKANTGKTETLRILARILVCYGAELQQCYNTEISSPEEPSLPKKIPKEGDFMAYLNYEGIHICICTGGDNEPALKRNIKFFENYSSDIYISATRTKGATCKTLNGFAEDEKIKAKVVWFGKTACKCEDNYSCAKKLDIREILAYLTKKYDVFKEIDIYE